MSLAQNVADRAFELKMPLEELQRCEMQEFYKHEWVLITVDLPDDNHTSFLINPDADYTATMELVLADSDK